MKMRTLLFTFALFGVLVSGAAQAAVVNFTGSGNPGISIEMTPLEIGQDGDLFGVQNGRKYFFTGEGMLPSMSQITFSYTITGSEPVSEVQIRDADYSFTDGGTLYHGLTASYADSDGTEDALAEGFIGSGDSTPSAPLLLSFAQVDATHGFATITNMALTAAHFVAFFALKPGPLTVHYSIASVPLPAALPMFGAGLVGLAGFVRSRRKRA